MSSSQRTRVTIKKINTEQVGQRLDNFLLRCLKGAPRSLIYRIIRSGEVRVNGGRIKPLYRLKLDDEVRIPPVSINTPTKPVAKQLVQAEQISILFEDEDLMVVDKPSGMAVHAGSGVDHGLIELLRAKTNAPFLDLAHRLDRETSGCLLLAKKRQVLVALHEQLKVGDIDKRYQALVVGKWPARLNKVDLPLDTDARRSGERHVRVAKEGKEAVTTFAVVDHFNGYTLVEASPKTGRTHQIRVHAAASGYALAGDLKYGEAEANQQTRALGLKRLFLHAASLRFQHPKTKQLVTVDAKLPKDLISVLEKL